MGWWWGPPQAWARSCLELVESSDVASASPDWVAAGGCCHVRCDHVVPTYGLGPSNSFVVGGVIMYFLADFQPFVQSVGFAAVFTEACLGVPQFLRNIKNKSTYGMR